MIFPCFVSGPVNGLVRDKLCRSPQSDDLFLRHGKFDICSLSGVARRNNKNENNKKNQTDNPYSFPSPPLLSSQQSA